MSLGGSLDPAYFLTLFGIVAFGAVVPIVPTGAAVSIAAALAKQDNPLILVLVVLTGAVGAYLGDIITYGILRLAGQPLAQRVGWLHDGPAADTLDTLREQVENHQLRILLLSRLIPGGRVPVLLATALGGYSWRRFAVADVGAAALWSVMYAAVGLAGRAVFPEPWQGALAAAALVIVISALGSLWDRRRDHAHRIGPAK